MTSKYKTWQDSYGFIHVQNNPTTNGSENCPLFTAEVELLLRMNGKTSLTNRPRWEMLKASDTQFLDRATGTPQHFSHDNMTGLYIAKELGLHNMDLPIIRWDSKKEGKYDRKYWLHPRDVIFYGLLSNKFWGYLLAPLLILFSIDTYTKPYEETSGKCLWFARFGVLSLSDNLFKRSLGKIGLVLGLKLMRHDHGDEAFQNAFGYYFKEYSHPVNQEIREWTL